MSDGMSDETGFVEPVDRLIYELTKTVNHLPPPTWRRVRFAVTEAEWEMLREYCLKRDSRWHGRIRDIPLVIEDKPLDPPCYVEGRLRRAAAQHAQQQIDEWGRA